MVGIVATVVTIVATISSLMKSRSAVERDIDLLIRVNSLPEEFPSRKLLNDQIEADIKSKMSAKRARSMMFGKYTEADGSIKNLVLGVFFLLCALSIYGLSTLFSTIFLVFTNAGDATGGAVAVFMAFAIAMFISGIVGLAIDWVSSHLSKRFQKMQGATHEDGSEKRANGLEETRL